MTYVFTPFVTYACSLEEGQAKFYSAPIGPRTWQPNRHSWLRRCSRIYWAWWAWMIGVYNINQLLQTDTLGISFGYLLFGFFWISSILDEVFCLSGFGYDIFRHYGFLSIGIARFPICSEVTSQSFIG